MKRRICVIEMGGTISSRAEKSADEFYKGPTHTISSLIKELELVDTEVFTETILFKISHDITSLDLLDLAKKLQFTVQSDECDGVVVTIGTNALEDVAYFVGLLVITTKPIVFTGANFPQNSLNFDGKKNLSNAIRLAASPEAEKLGVMVTFNDYVVTAREAIKINPGFVGNFSLDGAGVIGYVLGGKFILKSIPNYRHTYNSEFILNEILLLPKISIIYAFIGMDDLIVRASISGGVSGIVSAGFGKGYQPINVTHALSNAVESGIPVVRCSRTGIGYTNRDNLYDDQYGFIVSKDLTPHKTSLLLSVALCFSNDMNWLQKVFEVY